ncbi:MAG: hypothetical protein ACR2PO_17100 [Methyloligellaceae bacterium]
MDVLWILIALTCVPLVWALSRWIGRGGTPPGQRGRIYLRRFLIEHGTDPGVLTPACVEELIDEAMDFMDQLPDQNFHVQYTTYLQHIAAIVHSYISGGERQDEKNKWYRILARRGAVQPPLNCRE